MDTLKEARRRELNDNPQRNQQIRDHWDALQLLISGTFKMPLWDGGPGDSTVQFKADYGVEIEAEYRDGKLTRIVAVRKT